MVDVAHDGDDGSAGLEVALLHLVVLLEVLGQEGGLLLLAWVDPAHLGAQLDGEELDHVVGQALVSRDHLALQQQEAHHVTGGAV